MLLCCDFYFKIHHLVHFNHYSPHYKKPAMVIKVTTVVLYIGNLDFLP